MSATDFGRVLIELLELDLDKCTLTYGVLPCTASGGVGNECYNTYKTCQDKVNYSKGTQTLRFCGRGAPLPTNATVVRPYIESMSLAPVEIDLKNGLATRAHVSVKLVDETDSDVETDPYAATRATAARGSFWVRLLARNPNTAGRFARVKRLLAAPDSAGRVSYATTDPGFITDLYVIDSIKGPARGDITLTLKDPIKLADRVQVPVATDGKLASGVTSTATTLPLTAGKGAQYDKYGYPCWVLVGKEIVKIDSRGTDTLNVNASGHAQFGTVAAAHNADDKVQLCRVWSSAVFTDVLKNLLNESGVSNTYIDTAQMTSEDINWLGAKYYVTACLIKPEEASKLMAELLVQANSLLWWEPVAMKVKFKVNMPAVPGVTVPELNESAHLIEDSVSVESLESDRLTLAAVNYALTSPIENNDESANYQRGEMYIDTDAEGANEYNERRSDMLFSRWFGAANAAAMVALVNRRINARRDAPLKIKFAIDPKDYNFGVGALVDINTRAIAGFNGVNNVTRARVTRILDKGGRLDCEGISTKFRNRYCYIAPNGYPDYTAASDAQRVYGYICNTSGKMSNGDAGYLII